MNVSVDSILFGDDNLVLRIRANASEEASTGRPLHLGILLDNSGSMGSGRLDSVKRTLHAARPLLRPGDCITLVTFSDTATVALRQHELTEDPVTFDALFHTIDNIQADSSTNLSAGLEALYEVTTTYDAVILLTDGIVNAGVTSTAGLRAMAQAARATMVFHTLGYGADHNRTLLRELSVQSRGTYTYVDSDEILPLAIGDILSGLRAEVLRGVRVGLPPSTVWRCCEVGSQGRSDYYVGNMMAGRDYWAVFRVSGEGGGDRLPGPYQVTAEGHDGRVLMPVPNNITAEESHEQVLRSRVTEAMEMATNALEARRSSSPDLAPLRALQVELEGMPARPLLLRLRAQIAEILELLQAPQPSSATSLSNLYCSPMRGGGAAAATADHIMARMSSGMACLSNQRGVYRTTRVRATMSGIDDDADVSFFSTPSQRSASQAVYSQTVQTATATATATAGAEPEPDEPIGISVPAPPMEEID
jgi:hypothetical protein